jgi:N-acetylglucosamine kinase-like BadF-type ATPase
MICGWAGSLLCRDGISIVAGTGSIGYGERAGAAARSGGWGELFSDEGSAYWIACRGLNLFARMSDGRAEPGPLYEIVRQASGIGDDLDLCGMSIRTWAAIAPRSRSSASWSRRPCCRATIRPP